MEYVNVDCLSGIVPNKKFIDLRQIRYVIGKIYIVINLNKNRCLQHENTYLYLSTHLDLHWKNTKTQITRNPVI